jgi:hypothetical protein
MPRTHIPGIAEVKHSSRKGLVVPRPGTLGEGSVELKVAAVITEVNQKFGTAYTTPKDVMQSGEKAHKRLYQRRLGI